MLVAGLLFEKLVLVILGLELLVHDLEGVTDDVVLALQSSETGQDRVVDAANEDNFLEGVIGLLIINRISVRRNFLHVSFQALCQMSFHVGILQIVEALSAPSIHEVGQELGSQAHSVFVCEMLELVLLVAFEEDGESRVAVEALGAKVVEMVAVSHLKAVFSHRTLQISIHEESFLFDFGQEVLSVGFGAHRFAKDSLKASPSCHLRSCRLQELPSKVEISLRIRLLIDFLSFLPHFVVLLHHLIDENS